SLNERLADYAKSGIADDWPEMWPGGESPRTRKALADPYGAILSDSANSPRDAVVIAELLDQLDHVTQVKTRAARSCGGDCPGPDMARPSSRGDHDAKLHFLLWPAKSTRADIDDRNACAGDFHGVVRHGVDRSSVHRSRPCHSRGAEACPRCFLAGVR